MRSPIPRRLPPAIGACVSLAVISAVALGVLPQQQGTVDLLTQANVTINGAAANEFSGWSVAPAGDVNGDGRADVIVGAPAADPGSRADAGSSYVIFGQASLADVDLAGPLGSRGFRINGALAGDSSGIAVASAGDVNGDGRADVIVGARDADPGSPPRPGAGCSYVVYGQPSSADVELASLGSRGFRIDGVADDDWTGQAVASAGDVNGDGLADVIVGAPRASVGIPSWAGSSYVILGQAAPTDVDLAVPLGSRGFRIDGADDGDTSGSSVASAGDLNGDGLADVIVGAPGADPGSRLNAGSSYVIYGEAAPTDVDLAVPLGSRGFRIDGASLGDVSGDSVASAGDLNGDGRPDLIVGAPNADPGSRLNAGSSYVIYGEATPTDVNLGALGSRGFRIDGASSGDATGRSVASAGDLNGDGRPDVVVGAPQADPSSRLNAGSSYVIYGEATPTDVDLAALGSRGVRVDGGRTGDNSGRSVASAGDLNGDGRPDLIVGAPNADPGSPSLLNAGSTYAIYGFGAASVSYPGAITGVAGTPVATATPIVRRTGTATFRVSPALPAGIGFDTSTGVISGTPTTAATGTHTVTMTDLSGTASTSVALTVKSVPATPPAAGATPTAAATPTPAKLKMRVSCKARACASTGAVPAGVTRIAQAAAAKGRKAATGTCRITTVRKGNRATRAFTCRLGAGNGTWTITTSARAKDGTVVAQSVVTKRLK